MSDLIRREDAIKQIEYHQNHKIINRIKTKYALEMVKSSIEELPTAEPKVGRWIEDGVGDKCSECGMSFPDLYPLYNSASYCPNCGAKMERRAGERKKITIERNICPKPECGDEFPIPKEGWKGASDDLPI